MAKSLLLIYGQDYLGKAAPAIALVLLVIAFTLRFLLAMQKRAALEASLMQMIRHVLRLDCITAASAALWFCCWPAG